MKLFDGEVKVMEILWNYGSLPASDLAKKLESQYEWKTTTAYTVIKRCIKKGFIKKEMPHSVCIALIKKDEAQYSETKDLIERIFDGSAVSLFANFLSKEHLSQTEIDELKKQIEKLE